ncbi:MAG: AraC family transcriptional regulator [Bacteroides oleiciplenus]|uniref:AraC family transcriptional regulator n=1 Tax=Bacteroides stercorirosoris TaxID=871324 RepID=A0A413H115_9BACE|nr:AraC family transcriptional regulator [Bacteroides stercorirosoris]OKZ10099.1 MAG: AraC family transcriptional regulator [Bacteroides oleiciplenus]RGX77100.1 AraC family transcriptional regulator [Bacteroides stercorirosoris]
MKSATRRMINEQLPISESSPIKARFYDYAHFTYPWHFHAEYEIIYFKEGTGTSFIGNNMENFKDGDFILIGSNLPHYMKSDDVYHAADSSLRTKGTIIQFEQDFMQYSIRHYIQFTKIKKLLDDSQRGIYFPAGCSGKALELLESIPLESGMDQILSILQLFKEMSDISSKVILPPSEQMDQIRGNSRIDKILAYLNQHYTRHMDLNEISCLAAMSPASFCRFFKSKTGKTLKNYILDMRIGYACKLLSLDNMNISQISTECGFDTISHFNKSFKKNTGFTPTEYRRMLAD